MNEIFIAELMGTLVLVLLGNGVVSNVVLKGTKGNGGGWMVITTGWALAVFIGVTIAGPYSGAHLNPAVTVALAAAGSIPWAQVPTYIGGQMIGGMIGAFLVWVMYKDHFDAHESAADKLGCFATGPAIRNTPLNFISEVLGTFVLIYAILYTTGMDVNLVGDSVPAVNVGLGTIGAIPVTFAVWVAGLSLGGTTGYAINPARDLAPRIVHQLLPIEGSSDWSYSWIPVLGPIAGGLLAVAASYLLPIV